MEQDGGALLTIGVSINGGTPITGWFISWKIPQKWMMPGGTPHDLGILLFLHQWSHQKSAVLPSTEQLLSAEKNGEWQVQSEFGHCSRAGGVMHRAEKALGKLRKSSALEFELNSSDLTFDV
jgi:hypothetical protein